MEVSCPEADFHDHFRHVGLTEQTFGSCPALHCGSLSTWAVTMKEPLYNVPTWNLTCVAGFSGREIRSISHEGVCS